MKSDIYYFCKNIVIKYIFSNTPFVTVGTVAQIIWRVALLICATVGTVTQGMLQ